MREVDAGAANDGGIDASPPGNRKDTPMNSKTGATVLAVANGAYAELRGGHDESVYQQAMAFEETCAAQRSDNALVGNQ